MRKHLIVLTGCSGAGKTTVGLLTLKKLSTLKRLVTYTTRKPRPGEKNHRDYHFIIEKLFLKKIKSGEFFEWAKVYNHYYGNSKNELKKLWKKYPKVLLIIDMQGAMTIKKKMPDSTVIFLKPDQPRRLLQRLLRRGKIAARDLKTRLAMIRKETSQAKKCANYIVINPENKIQKAVNQIIKIIRKL